MISFTLLLIAVATLAYFDAKREALMIGARPGGPDLDHKELIWRRLRNIGALVMVAVVCDGTEGWDALWMGLCHAVGAWSMFTCTHRLSLNLMRRMDWRYVAPWGNLYDHLIWTVAHFFGCHPFDWTEVGIRYHQGNAKWHKSIHRAGTLAYIFEVFVLSLSLIGSVYFILQ